jgi:iodotyrosine deiodinase
MERVERRPAIDTKERHSPEPPFVPHAIARLDDAEARRRGEAFLALCRSRRTVRDFSSEPVQIELIDLAIEAAGLAPSGANQQPWTFVVVGDPALKRRMREAAEEEERASYGGRMPDEWLSAIAHLGTDWRKPHIEEAPWVVVVFEQTAAEQIDPATGKNAKHYYSKESVGLATGFFLLALQAMGLAALTHTPSPMNFLRDLLERPKTEKPFALIPVGRPAPDCRVPDLKKKPLDEIRVRHG